MNALAAHLQDSVDSTHGTDARGYILGASYGVAKNTAVAFRYFSGDSISGPPLSIDVFQFDLNLKF